MVVSITICINISIIVIIILIGSFLSFLVACHRLPKQHNVGAASYPVFGTFI